jgi:hypothetical protein
MDEKQNTVTLNGRVFELTEPSVAQVLSILNVIGLVGIKAEKAAAGAVKEPTSRAALFGLMAVMSQEDLVKFGLAVLQIGDDKKQAAWLRDNLKVAPLLDAFFINLNLSTDLLEALKSFFKGAALFSSVVEMFVQKNTPTPTGESTPTTDQDSGLSDSSAA